MKDYLPKIVMLVIGVILLTILLPARNQVGKATTQLPAKTNLGKVLSKHSALPPVAQFGPTQVEGIQDQERRRSRQRLS